MLVKSVDLIRISSPKGESLHNLSRIGIYGMIVSPNTLIVCRMEGEGKSSALVILSW